MKLSEVLSEGSFDNVFAVDLDVRYYPVPLPVKAAPCNRGYWATVGNTDLKAKWQGLWCFHYMSTTSVGTADDGGST
ncbi:hypothetical protein MO867_12930 [Microbulbifer sp. OS29]|uniref:Uncharacterized protein n=1 Tax=Microbulbifer okhotskensis TaxID=2926617 RepID=A0A9X2EN11_9GAMM|nr:hypothetical protein [Microbulbifer okhotskensis]MCO1335237.1 hypothetical protein [Microbulbifer okhotskensis]